MERSQILRKLIADKGLSVKAFSEQADMPYTTVHSILERGVGKSSVDNVIKICKTLGVTIEDLENMAKESSTEEIKNKPIVLAAHFDGEKFAEEEMEEINNYVKFLISKRNK